MIRNTAFLLTGMAALWGLPAVSHAVTFQELARFDVAGASDAAGNSYVGNNPSAVAWDGNQLYIAGFNSAGGTADTGVVEITNAGSTGLNAATYGTPFGVYSTPNLRGYSGLDLDSGVLAAAYDDGAADANGIQAFDASSNTQTWAKNARGGSGVNFDPGFPGGDPALGSGVAWLTFGSGRRSLQDTTSGADIWTTSDGMIITPGGGSFWRDLDFDSASGDFYGRRANDVIMATRTGDNGTSGPTAIVDTGENGAFTAGQMIEFMETDAFGGVVIYNDRPNTGAQAFADAVKVIDPAGVALSATFVLIGGGAPADGAGYYDFDFDPETQTLAVMDFANRNVHIFGVVPEPASLGLVACGLLVGAIRRRV